ncbi:MAG: HAD-IA family hydrolase [Pseudomonadales bacterium]
MVECLLFDCDGTLVDSEHLCNQGLVEAFTEYGVTLATIAMVKEFRGWKLSRILDTLQSRHNVTLAENFVPQYRDRVSALFEAELKPIEDIKYALSNLPQAKAVVSNGPPAKIAQSLRLCGLADFFGSNIVSAYDVNLFKPDPEIYKYAARSMGFDCAQCAVIDDGIVGIEAGVKAGMKTFFYNVLDENCAVPGAISFNTMRDLPSIVSQ